MEQPLDMGLLKSGMLFRNMTDGELLDVLEATHARRQVFPSKAVVVRDGDSLSELGILLSGGLHLSHVDVSGNSNLMDALGPGDAIGLLNAIGRYRLHISAVATEKTELLFLTVDTLLRQNRLTVPAQIRFLQNLTVAVAQQGQRLTRKLEDSIRRSAQYHKAGSRTFVIPLNRQDLADYLFVDRSAMSNELCKMRDEGLIQFEKSRFELLVEMPITEDEPDPNLKSE